MSRSIVSAEMVRGLVVALVVLPLAIGGMYALTVSGYISSPYTPAGVVIFFVGMLILTMLAGIISEAIQTSRNG